MNKPSIKSKDISIRLISVSKKYEIHHEKPTFVEKFIKGKNETFWALNDINLTINKGEKLGIIGPNGSGKTTLLKIITGITSPTKGQVEIHGKVVSLIDLEAGFHADLTGIQNIYLSGMLLGMKRKDINSKIFNIIDFAELKQFIDVPLYTYSQGMILRLAFSVSTIVDPDILILDENIFVGDKFFQKKVDKKLNDLFKKNKTVVIVSHNLNFLKKKCTRFIWIEKAKIILDGSSSILNKYQKL